MNRLIDFMEKAGAVFLFIIMILIATTSVTRYLFNWPLPDGDAISGLLLAIVVFWGFAAACLHNEHIQFDLIAEFVPARAKQVITTIALFITLAAVTAMTAAGFQRVVDFAGTQEKTYELGLPLWPAYAVAWCGLVASVLVLVWLLACRSWNRPD